jgi:hypothetical protein
LERTVTAPHALRKELSIQQTTEWLTAYAKAIDSYEERKWSRHKQTAKRTKRHEKIAAEKARIEASVTKMLEMEAAISRGLYWDEDEDDESDSTSPLPAPRDAEHFEEICAIFLKRIGHGSAMRTPTGPDGGIDVISIRAVGQAKFHPSQKVSAEPIRALAGSRLEHEKQEAYFFHYGPGYTDDAINVGHKLGAKLYEFDAQRRVFCRRA